MSVLKNTILASIGAIQVTRDKAEKIIDDLIKKGELDQSDRKKAVMELLQKAEKSTAELRDKISDKADKTQLEIDALVKKLNVARESDLKKLEEKVDALTELVRKLEERLDESGKQK